MPPIFVGQGIAKDCIVGDRLMDRYGIFNGLQRPRRIDPNLKVSLLGFDAPVINSVTSVATAGALVNNLYYAYRAVYASYLYTRLVAVLDGSSNYTRGNGSAIVAQQATNVSGSMSVVVQGSSDIGVTHVLLYRSTGASTSAEAQNGPFYYMAKAANVSPTTTIVEGVDDALKGVVMETDNYPWPSYRYAVAAEGWIFAGGNYPLGQGYTCTVTPASGTVIVSSPILYDGVRGWFFKCLTDTTGGVNGGGLYYANYVDSTTLQLVDATGANTTYNGSLNGAGQTFTVYLPGNVMQWCKYGEPEAVPNGNTILFEGNIAGIAEMPNLPYLIVCTDTPAIWMFDLTQANTAYFSTNRRKLSSQYTTTSHYSLCGVDAKLRAIDATRQAIIEIDGVTAVDITRSIMPDIWRYLDRDLSKIVNWHCAYDNAQKLFGAFVTFHDSQRQIDFCLGQNTITGGWFFNFEKDLLCTGNYVDPITGEFMVLGGTQGLPSGGGACWGRIWCPGTYDEWLPTGSLRSGTITGATNTTITVDVSGGTNLYTGPNALIGRWVLVCDAQNENQQMAYIGSNTASQIVVDTVVNGVNALQFNPVPSSGWKFYIGLIEMRWGPKRFDFNDPDIDKNVLEVMLVMSGYDLAKPPFIRIYRGFDVGYTAQRTLQQASYKDKSANQCLYHRHESLLEPVPRWGVAVLDRSYLATTLRNLTVVHNPVGTSVKKV